MSIEIKAATRLDAKLLAELGTRTSSETFARHNRPSDMELFLRQTFGEPIQAKELADERRHLSIAWSAQEPVGYLHLFQGPVDGSVKGPAPIELLRFYVVGAFQGKGVAAAMMQATLEIARALGHETLWLGVWERNLRAQAFYRKWSFREVGSHAFVVGTDPQRDLVLQREL